MGPAWEGLKPVGLNLIAPMTVQTKIRLAPTNNRHQGGGDWSEGYHMDSQDSILTYQPATEGPVLALQL